MAQAAVFQDQLAGMEERLRTVNRLMTTKAAIAQTPKQLVWTLNKAKLYRYIPVVPPEKRHPIPLLLIFALMNRPYILDLRPGHSFVEFMVNQGYDVYLLDWGAPGFEDRHMKFDDYTLEYMPEQFARSRHSQACRSSACSGGASGAILTTFTRPCAPTMACAISCC